MREKIAIIIGAGPAGLTAACELLRRTDIKPIVLEMSTYMGGLSRTVEHKGNRIDIGGHRFFSKSDRVMKWWLERMPLEKSDQPADSIDVSAAPRASVTAPGDQDDKAAPALLLRSRRSRIYYRRQFFDYPISLSVDTLKKLGLMRVLKIGASYARSMLFPIRNESSLEDFFINRFGRELYHTFFESYTEKVWGRSCSEISSQWGAQRIKGLSIGKALWHALKKPFTRDDVAQKGVETSLIEQFLYPKLGPGQMWEEVAREVESLGGRILTNLEVRRIEVAGNTITGVEAVDAISGRSHIFEADYVFSTMPVKQLVRALATRVPDAIRRIGEGLVYRDFITVGLLLSELKIKHQTEHGPSLIRDNWIYVQEPDVTVGRLQIFNNWSPHLVADRSKVWIGMEYFCDEHGDFWVKSDEHIARLAAAELVALGMIDSGAVLDATVIRMPKAYPAYFGSYDRFDELKRWLDGFGNLFLIGRNGMHRYNNMDHSMLTAMTAVDNIVAGRTDTSNIWAVNADEEYHEVRTDKPAAEPSVEVREAPLSDTPVPADRCSPADFLADYRISLDRETGEPRSTEGSFADANT